MKAVLHFSSWLSETYMQNAMQTIKCIVTAGLHAGTSHGGAGRGHYASELERVPCKVNTMAFGLYSLRLPERFSALIKNFT